MKTISISYFKAHMSEEMKRVKDGESLLIKDRSHVFAEVVPAKADYKPDLVLPKKKKAAFKPKEKIKFKSDPLSELWKDRSR